MKVVTTNDAKKAGKALASKSVAGSNEVIAVRNGSEQTFTRQIWDHLPQDKEGWQEIVETPAASASTSKQPANTGAGDKNTGLTPKQLHAAASADYKAAFGVAPEQNLTTEDIRVKLAEKKVSDDKDASDREKAITDYTSAFGVAPDEELATSEINQLIADKEADNGQGGTE